MAPLLLAIAFAIVCALPQLSVGTIFIAGEVDWLDLLQHATASGWTFGEDIIIGYGPLGFLMAPRFHPQTWVAMLVLWSLIAAAAAIAWSRQLEGMRPWVRGGIVALVAVVGCSGGMRDPWVTALALLLVLEGASEKPRHSQLFLLASLLGVLSMVKFTYLMASAAAIGVAAALELWRRRRFAWEGFVFAGSAIVAWVAAGQPLGALLPHLRSNLAIAGAYAAAAGAGAENLFEAFVHPLAFVLAGAVLLWLIHEALGWSASVPTALLLFLTMKAGYLRHDPPHAIIAAEFLFLGVLALPPKISARYSRAFVIVVALLLAGAAWGTSASVLANPLAAITRPAQSMTTTFALIRNPRATTEAWLRQRQALREVGGTSGLRGSIDSLTFGQSLAIASPGEYRPRPASPSYFASYHSSFMRRNAVYYAERGPDFILFDLQTLDSRFPTLDDSLALLELWRHYDPVSKQGQRLLLRRREVARPISIRSLVASELKLGEPLHLPPQTPLWLQMDLEMTVWGKIQNFLIRPAPLYIDVEIEGEAKRRRFRMVQPPAQEGFIVSPLIETAEEFFATREGVDPARRVRAITIVEERSLLPRCWKPTAPVRISVLAAD